MPYTFCCYPLILSDVTLQLISEWLSEMANGKCHGHYICNGKLSDITTIHTWTTGMLSVTVDNDMLVLSGFSLHLL